jgi:hypothetical protein
MQVQNVCGSLSSMGMAQLMAERLMPLCVGWHMGWWSYWNQQIPFSSACRTTVWWYVVLVVQWHNVVIFPHNFQTMSLCWMLILPHNACVQAWLHALMHACAHICLHMYFIHMHAWALALACINICMGAHIHGWMDAWASLCMCMHGHAWIHVHTFIWTCTHWYIH